MMCSGPEVNISLSWASTGYTWWLKYYESQQPCVISRLITWHDYIDSALLQELGILLLLQQNIIERKSPHSI